WYLNWLWQREGWMIFIGWLSYFLLGFYMGYYYETLMANIQKYTKYIVLGTVIVTVITLINYLSGGLTLVDSKRIDTPIYVTMIILVYFIISSYVKYLPKFFILISNYSFLIYLIFFFFLFLFCIFYSIYIFNILV